MIKNPVLNRVDRDKAIQRYTMTSAEDANKAEESAQAIETQSTNELREHCPFCHKEAVVLIQINVSEKDEWEKVHISPMGLKVCTSCQAAFLPARRLPAISRELESYTRREWREMLLKLEPTWKGDEAPVCMEHGQPLVKGKIPDYGFEGWRAECCDGLHLPPVDMVRILNIGIDQNAAVRRSGKYKDRGGLFQFLGKPLFWLYSKLSEDATDDDPFEGAQWELKFRKVLGV